jgi:glycosyltransferase involved in cell wall biosynthesis
MAGWPLGFGVLGAATVARLWSARRDEPGSSLAVGPAATAQDLAVPRAPAAAGGPAFSVVIATYNRAGLVAEAVASVLAQRRGDFELIVVDDGSTDDTFRRLRRIRDRRLRALHIPHGGVAAARNAGLAVATADWVAFLDSDDLWKPDKLEREADFLVRHPHVGAVFSDLEKVDGRRFVPSFMRTTQVFSRRLGPAGAPELLLGPREMYLCLLEEVPIKTPALTVRRRLLARLGGFDERWPSSEDWELLLRLAPTTTFGYIDRPLATIRISRDSLHRLDQERGDRLMLQRLSHLRRGAGDPQLRAAARRGIRTRARHLTWFQADSGRRLAAAATSLRWFLATGSLELLLRAGSTLLRPRRCTA